jgi:hypothetical protein
MRGQDIACLLALAALWGGSFLFMRMAALMLGLIYAGTTGRQLALRQFWQQYLLSGIVNQRCPSYCSPVPNCTCPHSGRRF